MKIAVSALALVSAATLTTVAHADSQSEATAAQRGELSQINGTPVPVGDHNQYFYGHARVNLSVDPIGLMAGEYNLAGSYALSDHVVLRGEVMYWDKIDSDSSIYEIDAGLPIYFRRAFQGAFLEPGFMVRGYRDAGYDGETLTSKEQGPQVLLGYHWMWDSGLNVAIAGGLGRNLGGDDNDVDGGDGDELFFNGYLKVGYAF
jgi:hypothetical protein